MSEIQPSSADENLFPEHMKMVGAEFRANKASHKDIELNDNPGGNAMVPALGSFVRRTSCGSPKRRIHSSPPKTNSQEQQNGAESPSISFPSKITCDDETVLQRGGGYSSTCTDSALIMDHVGAGFEPHESKHLDIEFCPEHVEESPPTVSQGSFVAASILPPTRKASLEINFSPENIQALTTPAPPKQGSFMEKQVRASPTKTTPDTDIEFNPPGVDGGNVSFSVPKLGSYVEKERGQTTDTAGKQHAQREINFTPDKSGSKLPASPPPIQGSYIEKTIKQSAPLPSLTIEAVRSEERKETPTTEKMDVMQKDTGFNLGSMATTTVLSKKGSYVEHNPKRSKPNAVQVPEKEINFSPGGSCFPTAAPPRQGSYVEKLSPVARPGPQDIFFAESKEINFCPGGSSIRSSGAPPNGSFHVKEKCSFADEEADQDEESAAFQANDLARWKAEKEVWDREKASEPSSTKHGVQVDPNLDDFIPDDSIRKMEVMLDDALDVDFTTTPKDDDRIMPSISTDDSTDLDPGNSMLKMEGMFESALNEELKDENLSGEEATPKEEESLPPLNINAEQQQDIANTGSKLDDFVPDDSISRMEAMLDAALDDDIDLDKLLKDRPAQSVENKKAAENLVTQNDFAPDDSLAKLEALLDEALDSELDATDSLRKNVATGSGSGKQNRTGLITVASPSKSKGAFSSNKKVGGNIKPRVSVTTPTKIPAAKPIAAPRSRTMRATKPLSKKVPTSGSGPITVASPNKSKGAFSSNKKVTGNIKPRLSVAATTKKPAAKPVAAPRSRTIRATKSPSKKVSTSGSVDQKNPTGRFMRTSRNVLPSMRSANKKESQSTALNLKAAMGPASKKAGVSGKVGEDKTGRIGQRQIISPKESKVTSNLSDEKKPKSRKELFRNKLSTFLAGTKKERKSRTAATLEDSKVPNASQPKTRQPRTEPGSKKLFSSPSRSGARKPKQQRYYSSSHSVGSLTSQCSVTSFSNPRRSGHRGCQAKFQPYLHGSRGPCELCVFFLSDADRALLGSTGRHYRVMFTTGGCCSTCEVFPRSFDEPAVRLCRACFYNTHREVYQKAASKRNILRK